MSLLRRLGPLAMLVLALAAPPAGATTKDCRHSTPLPDDVRLTAPAPDVPPTVARFAGAWSGVWLDPGGDEVLCQTLVVEEVFPNGYARVVHSRASYLGWNLSHPTFWRATGRVTDGVLRFVLPTPDRVELTYRFDDGVLASTVSDRRGSHGALTRLGEMSQIECGRAERTAPVTPPATTRDRLTGAELLAPSLPSPGPVHNDYFRPIGAWGAAKHTLAGTLTIGPAPIYVSSQGCPSLPTPSQAVTLEFFTAGEHLVPVNRDFVPPAGRLIVSPGRVWSEPGDGGMSRASFPFILVNPVHNGAHNGVATFLFDDTHVSGLRVQVVQETSAWERLDFWGHLPLAYVPGPIANEAALRADFAEELRRQAPMQPWAALPATPALAAFDGEPAPADISANGLVVDGVLYVRGCNTRYGPFPYYREMRHGVFSVTKSLGAAVALLRLAQKYGDAVLDEKLVDYLPPGSQPHPGWDGVTFADALNMATGIGDEGREPRREHVRRRERGEDAPLDREASPPREARDRAVLRKVSVEPRRALPLQLHPNVRAGGRAGHLSQASRGPRRSPLGPGAGRGVPSHRDLSRARDAYDRGRWPPRRAPARLRPLPDRGRRREADHAAAERGPSRRGPAAERDEAGRGAVPDRPAERTPVGPAESVRAGRYHLSFWSVPYRTSTGCFFQIPEMLGYGGNLVALLPNGVSVFRFADAFDFDVDGMIQAGESLRPFCAPVAAPEPTPPRVVLTESELLTELGGHVLAVGPQRLFFAAGGRLYGASGKELDVGTWEISSEGRLCRRWHVWDHGRARCYVVYRRDDGFELELPERFTRFVARPHPGAFDE